MRLAPDHGERSYVGMGRLKGKRALITGGDSGIGKAVAIAFAREGADIAFSCLEAERDDGEDTRRLIKQVSSRVAMIIGDLSDPAFIQRLVDETVQQLGGIDILVNNAAYQGKAVDDFSEFDAEGVEHTLRVNVLAPFLLSQAVLPFLSAGSSIINVASVQAYLPSAGILACATTKGALVTFTKGLAQSLADRGIRVNCVAPGPVWTPLIQQSFDAEKVAQFGGDNPMGRPAQPAELAPAFVFLASAEASFVSGEILGVTGGKPLG